MRKREKPRISKNNNNQKIFGNCKDNFVGETLKEKYPINLITFSKSDMTKNNYHPTQKPVALLEYLIKTYTNERETVLDNCMGSGSTGVACMNTNRDFIGMELEEKYYEVAKERINNVKN
jgi:site-specific DNA-methyltransferase (adenine-specific)